MTLGEYLKAPRPAWDWRTLDCCRWVDGWARACGWPSLIRAIDLSYDSERSALLTMKRGGGLVTLWSKAAWAVGMPEADDARAGDIGIIARATECGTDETAAIFTGERWVSLMTNGLCFAPADVLAMWRP